MPCSIIIPSKDRPAGLLMAVKSALAALPEGAEVLVVDDGCKVPAAEVLAPVAGPALRVTLNPGPNGPSGARNHGVDQARQPIVFFLDDDDLLMPEYCHRILDEIPRLPETVGYGFSAVFRKVLDGPHLYRGKSMASGVIADTSSLDKKLSALSTGFWIKKDVFQSVGGLDPALRVNEDTELSIRLVAAYVKAYYCAEPGVVIIGDSVRDAKDKKSITRDSSARQRAEGFEYILRKHDAFLQDHPARRRRFMLRAIKYRSRAGMVDGWTEFCSSLRPSLENRLIWANGLLWLKLSVALRSLKG